MLLPVKASITHCSIRMGDPGTQRCHSLTVNTATAVPQHPSITSLSKLCVHFWQLQLLLKLQITLFPWRPRTAYSLPSAIMLICPQSEYTDTPDINVLFRNRVNIADVICCRLSDETINRTRWWKTDFFCCWAGVTYDLWTATAITILCREDW